MADNAVQPRLGFKWLAPVVGAALCTFLIWATSPVVFSAIEPWDAPYLVYSVTTFLGGCILGYRFRGALLSSFLGAWLGQVVALLTLPGHDRTWFELGLVTTAIGSLFLVAGAFLGGLVRRLADA